MLLFIFFSILSQINIIIYSRDNIKSENFFSDHPIIRLPYVSIR